MAEFKFPDPVKVDPATRPVSPARKGRASMEPAYRLWLSSLAPGAEWEFIPPVTGDGVQPTDNSIARLNTLRKVAKEMNSEPDAQVIYKIESYATVKDKRFRIFATVQDRSQVEAQEVAAAS